MIIRGGYAGTLSPATTTIAECHAGGMSGSREFGFMFVVQKTCQTITSHIERKLEGQNDSNAKQSLIKCVSFDLFGNIDLVTLTGGREREGRKGQKWQEGL